MQSATDNYVLKSTKKNAIDAACSGVDSRTSQSQFAKSNIKYPTTATVAASP